jgi:hypothetical protein
LFFLFFFGVPPSHTLVMESLGSFHVGTTALASQNRRCYSPHIGGVGGPSLMDDRPRSGLIFLFSTSIISLLSFHSSTYLLYYLQLHVVSKALFSLTVLTSVPNEMSPNGILKKSEFSLCTTFRL